MFLTTAQAINVRNLDDFFLEVSYEHDGFIVMIKWRCSGMYGCVVPVSAAGAGTYHQTT